MKKDVLVGLGICLCLGLAGCGNTQNTQPQDVVSTVENQTTTDESAVSNVQEEPPVEEIPAQEEPPVEVIPAQEEPPVEVIPAQEEPPVEETPAQEEAPAEEETPEVETGATALSDNIYDFQIMVDGKVIQVPLSAQDLMAMGYSYDNSDGYKVPSNKGLLSQVFSAGKFKMYATLTNFDADDRLCEDCYVTSLKIEELYRKKTDAAVTVAKGIALGAATMDDVRAAYGDPSEEKGSEKNPTLVYSLDAYRLVSFRFSQDDDYKLAEIKIENIKLPEETTKSDNNVSSEAPEITRAYKAPAAITNNLLDYTMNFAGDLYQLPVTVSAMMDNGWVVLDQKENQEVEGDGHTRIELTKNNQTISVNAENYDANATVVKNCFLTRLKASTMQCDVDMEVANGIYKGMASEDLEKALEGYTLERDETSTLQFIEVQDPASALNGYLFTMKEGKVIEIEAKYMPKTSELRAQYGLN